MSLEEIKRRAEIVNDNPWLSAVGARNFIDHARTDIPKLVAALEAVDRYCDLMDGTGADIRSYKVRELIAKALS